MAYLLGKFPDSSIVANNLSGVGWEPVQDLTTISTANMKKKRFFIGLLQ